MADKQLIQQALVALVERQLATAQEAKAFLVKGSELDQDEGRDTTDLSQAETAADLASSYEEAVERAKRDLNLAQGLDMSSTDVVRPGAVIRFGGARYLVGLAAEAFDVDGVTYEGISTGSPVYQLIEGMRAGDSFSFNGSDHTLDAVS